jgi:GntR family transcriptional repressor for pyruvate dehydrogenase complex
LGERVETSKDRGADPATLYWPPLSRGTLSEEIADRLIKGIIGGEYRFGKKLPSERELARNLAVGRPTLREAIRRLAVIGLVEVRHGEGTFVVNEHAEFVAKSFGWAVLLDPKTARDVVETRMAIESEIAELAAQRASEEDIAKLRQLTEDLRGYQDDPDHFTLLDLEFHMLLAQAAKNVTLMRILDAIRSLLSQWIRRALSGLESYDLVVSQHERIVRAFEARSTDEARQAMRDHLAAMGELVVADSDAAPFSGAELSGEHGTGDEVSRRLQ